MGGDVEELGDAKDAIEPFEWNDLEERFWREMEECRKVEKEIEEDFAELLEVGLLSLVISHSSPSKSFLTNGAVGGEIWL